MHYSFQVIQTFGKNKSVERKLIYHNTSKRVKICQANLEEINSCRRLKGLVKRLVNEFRRLTGPVDRLEGPVERLTVNVN